MSKRKETKKTAVFKLEPDGFSIHTFELSQRLTHEEYHSIKESLYHQQENEARISIYKERAGRHCCTRYTELGVRILLECHTGEEDRKRFFLRMIVNPRKLIDPQSSYLGILPPQKSSIKDLKISFSDLFEGTIFKEDIDKYYLSRIDLCTNIRCSNRKLFRELIRVLRKLPTPPKYERLKYTHDNKKKANEYNKHYLRFHCGTHDLVIYDKTYQMRDGNLVVAYENLPEGVLRFEIHCGREYIREVSKKYGQLSTTKLLWKFVKESKSRLTEHFSRCFQNTEFVQMSEIEQRIRESSFKRDNKKMMLCLASKLQRIQSVDKALEKMKKDGWDTSVVLEKFEKLGISPIPLWQNFCAKSLPGVVELLRHISEGDFEVEYIKSKYK